MYSVQAYKKTECCSSMDYKDKTKCRPYLCLKEFIDWRYSQSCWYFRTSFVNYCPSNLLSCSPPPPPPPKVKVQYIQTVCVWEGVGGVQLCWRPYLHELNTLYLTRFRTYKIALPPQTRGGGLRQINTCHKVP